MLPLLPLATGTHIHTKEEPGRSRAETAQLKSELKKTRQDE
jgi:hypothetical protein